MITRSVLMLLLTILLISIISSIKITEVELNPPGNDQGSEWVELYSTDTVNIDKYSLMNNDGKKVSLSGSFQGYYVYIFEKQWLDNTNEKVSLYLGGNSIDETDILNDSANNEKTWQYCNGWEFKDQTKKRDNECEVVNEEKPVVSDKNSKKNETQAEDKKIIKVTNSNNKSFNENIGEEPVIPKVIKLSAKTIKSPEINQSKGQSNYAFYGLIAFAALLGVLFLLRRRKYRNEFRKD